ncbi:hypothetical protein CC80DRAFT_552555 [Byssothecium circinans]|uniref:Uncharacterized protein n=1 Tax=Byssothecium circinans TaxID=147558 RepID=A0A6A5TGZ6_9PLEO|nr:hypothetical protein CC80DRAFT_552555 [Byssothecium circinans]
MSSVLKSLFTSLQPTAKEIVTYPHIYPNPYMDPCLHRNTTSEHALSCGHSIITVTPDEPCAPNCMHIANDRGASKLKGVKAQIKSPDMKAKHVTKVEFWCDACQEERIEDRMKGYLRDSVNEADERRAFFRAYYTGENEGQRAAARKCYIGAKNVAVPCDKYGRASKVHRKKAGAHPFDTAIPRMGANIFEGVDPHPEREEDIDSGLKEGTNGRLVEISLESGGGVEKGEAIIAKVRRTNNKLSNTSSPTRRIRKPKSPSTKKKPSPQNSFTPSINRGSLRSARGEVGNSLGAQALKSKKRTRGNEEETAGVATRATRKRNCGSG